MLLRNDVTSTFVENWAELYLHCFVTFFWKAFKPNNDSDNLKSLDSSLDTGNANPNSKHSTGERICYIALNNKQFPFFCPFKLF